MTQKPVPASELSTFLGLGYGFVPTPKDLKLRDYQTALRAFKWRVYCKLQYGNKSDPNFNSNLHFADTPIQAQHAAMNKFFKDYPKGRAAFQRLEGYLVSQYNKPSKNVPNLNKQTLKDFNTLKNHKDLMISFTDKNLGPCIVDREQNHLALLSHLKFPTYATFTSVKGPFNKLREAMEKTIELCNNLVNHGWMDYTHRKFVLQHIPETPTADDIKWAKLYLLWKVHKPTLATRPICPSIGYPLHPLSTWLHHEISGLVLLKQHPFIANSSDEIIRDLERNTYPVDSVIASKDVTALYPSINIKDGCTAVEELLLERMAQNPEITVTRVSYIVDLLRLVMTTLFIKYGGKFFLQLIGTAMGTPVAVTFANCYLIWLERSLVNKYLSSGSLLYYKRYIDDLLGIFTSTTASDAFWIEYNALHPNIKLTGDPAGKKVVYLDLEISQSSNKYVFKPYQKAMNTYMFLPYSTHHTTATLKGMIKGELLRFATHASCKSDYLAIRQMHYNRLRIRGYPQHFLRAVFKTVCYGDRTKILYKDPTTSEKPAPLVMVLQHNPKTTALNIGKFLRENWTEELIIDMFGSDENQKPKLPVPILSLSSAPSLKKSILSANGRNPYLE